MFFYYTGYVVWFAVCVFIGMVVANIIRMSFKKDNEVADIYEKATLRMLVKLKKDTDRIEKMCDNIVKQYNTMGESSDVDRVHKVYRETDEIKKHVLQSYRYISNKKMDEMEKH